MAKYILVGADPQKSASQHPGGVLTLSIGLIEYARLRGDEIAVINTARSGFVQEPFHRTLLAGLGRVRTLFRMLKAGEISGVISFVGAGASFYERALMSLVCRCFRVKDVFAIVDGHFFGVREAGPVRRGLIKLLLRVPYRLAVTGSKWAALFDELGVSQERRIGIYYWLSNDFPVADHPKQIPEKRLHMLFVGWLTAGKGVPELLAAIEELIETEDFTFTFIGGGTLLHTVRNKIDGKDWQGRVSAPGWLSDAQLREEYRTADVFVLPSHAEGFPMSLIEAFSMGVPAIVSDVGGVSDSLRDGSNGYLVTPKSVASLVGAMKQYLDNPALVSAHSANALAAFHQNHGAARNCGAIFEALG